MNKDQKDALRLLPHLAPHFNVPSRTSTNSSPQNNTLGGATGIDDTAAIKAVAADLALHKLLDYADGHGPADIYRSKQKVYHSNHWGVVGDGVTDDSNAIETMLDYVGSNGGGTCVVSSLSATSSIYINKVINLAWSNTHLVFRSPIIRGGLAGIRIMGELGQYVAPGKAAAKLASNATAGALTLTLSNTTGGATPPMVDTDFSVGNKIVIRGRNTVSGKAEQKELNIITAINTSTHVLTLKYELDYTYQPHYTTGDTPIDHSDWPADATTGTTIYKLKFNAFNANVGRGSVYATLTANDYFAVGDLVMISGDETEWDMNNAAVKSSGTPPANRYANPCNMEFAKITAIGGTTIYFDRALLRDYTTAMNGGITLIEPVVNSSISGADITWNAEDASTSYTTLQMTYAEACQIYDCRINGFNLAITNSLTGLPGSGRVGQAIRMSYALNCTVHDVWIEGCGLSGSGQGYGITWYYNTLCYAYNCIVIGCRHNYLFQCATLGRLWDSESRRHLISGVDFHGVRDESCDVDNVMITQADDITTDSTIASGCRVGNTSHDNGSFRITISNCKFIANNGASDIAFDVVAASQEVKFINCYSYRAGIGFKLTLNSTQVGAVAIQTTKNVLLQGCIFEDCTDRPFKIAAATNPAASAGMLDGLIIKDCLDIRNTIHLEIVGVVSGVNTIQNVEILGYTVFRSISTSTKYGINVSDVTNLTIDKCNLNGANRGIKLTNCVGPAYVTQNTMLGLLDGAVGILDNGGNTGLVVVDNPGYDAEITLRSNVFEVDPAFPANVSTKRFTTITAALAAATTGTTIHLAPAVYAEDPVFPYDGIKLIGSGAAGYNVSGGTFTTGTIIVGKVNLNNQKHCTVANLTINVSASVKDAIIGGTQAASTTELDATIRNVNIVGNGPSAACHGILMESGSQNTIDNVKVYNCGHGIAFRSAFANVSNAYIKSCGISGIIVKSASVTGDAHDINFNNVIFMGEQGLIVEGYDTGTYAYNVNAVNITGYGNVGSLITTRTTSGTVLDCTFVNGKAVGNSNTSYTVANGDNIRFVNCDSNTCLVGFKNISGTHVLLESCISRNASIQNISGTFDQLWMNGDVVISGATALAAVTATSAIVDGSLKARQSGSTRYRTEIIVSGGVVYEVSYDDTGAAYIARQYQAASFLFTKPGVANILSLATTGSEFTGNLNVTGNISAANFAAGHQTIITRVNGSLGASATVTTSLPHNNSTPVITNGDQILSTSYSPSAASKTIKVTVIVPYASTDTTGAHQLNLWNGATCIGEITKRLTSGASSGDSFMLTSTFVSVSTSAVTIQARMGPDATGPTITLNAKFNGLSQPYMIIDEYA